MESRGTVAGRLGARRADASRPLCVIPASKTQTATDYVATDGKHLMWRVSIKMSGGDGIALIVRLWTGIEALRLATATALAATSLGASSGREH